MMKNEDNAFEMIRKDYDADGGMQCSFYYLDLLISRVVIQINTKCYYQKLLLKKIIIYQFLIGLNLYDLINDRDFFLII